MNTQEDIQTTKQPNSAVKFSLMFLMSSPRFGISNAKNAFSVGHVNEMP